MPGFIEIEARYLSFNQPDENGGPVRTEQTSGVASAVSVDSGRSEVAGNGPALRHMPKTPQHRRTARLRGARQWLPSTARLDDRIFRYDPTVWSGRAKQEDFGRRLAGVND
jgi:hypothetical protein